MRLSSKKYLTFVKNFLKSESEIFQERLFRKLLTFLMFSDYEKIICNFSNAYTRVK